MQLGGESVTVSHLPLNMGASLCWHHIPEGRNPHPHLPVLVKWEYTFPAWCLLMLPWQGRKAHTDPLYLRVEKRRPHSLLGLCWCLFIGGEEESPSGSYYCQKAEVQDAHFILHWHCTGREREHCPKVPASALLPWTTCAAWWEIQILHSVSSAMAGWGASMVLGWNRVDVVKKFSVLLGCPFHSSSARDSRFFLAFGQGSRGGWWG